MKFEQIPMHKFSRRAFLRALGGVSFVGLGGISLAACESLFTYPENGFKSPGMGALAARHGKTYGVATQSYNLDNPRFAAALRREVNCLVPEWELKWKAVHPKPDLFDFRGYYRLANFAEDNNMAMRGHAFVWHYANPDWLEPALTDKKTAGKILRRHMQHVLDETAPVIRNWDVVNEALDPHSRRDDGLRETIWLKAMGPDYIPFAFQTAHEIDPGLTLVYNDYGFEDGDNAGRFKRRTMLRLLEKYKKEGVPIHALGLQSHLQCGRPLGGGDFSIFLKEVRALGLAIYVTELDMDISHLKGRADDKIILAQNYLRAYLGMLQESGAIDMLLTWGLSDRYTWLREDNPGLTGALPLDADFNRTAFWETLRSDWAEV